MVLVIMRKLTMSQHKWEVRTESGGGGGIKNNNSDRQNINSGETDGVLLPLAQGFEAVGSVRKLTSDR